MFLSLQQQQEFGSIVARILRLIAFHFYHTILRDPFLLPADPSLKVAAAKSRKKFAADSKSDHMALLRVFQGSFFSFII